MRFRNQLILTAALAPLLGQSAWAEPTRVAPAPVSAQATVKRVDAAANRFLVQLPGSRPVLVMVTTSDTTQFQKSDGTDARLEDVTVGTPVWVEGPEAGNNLLAAHKVILSDAEGGKAVMGKGTVTSVDPAGKQFVVLPENSRSKKITVTTVKTTQLQKSDGTTARLADVMTGLQVELQGVSTETDLIAAQKIVLLDPNSGKAVSGMGMIVAADAGSGRLVVQPQDSRAPRLTITLTESTRFQRSDNTSATPTDLTIGVPVWIEGITTGANTVKARKVVVAAGNRNDRRGR